MLHKMFSTKSPSMPCKLFTLMQWHCSWAPIIMGNMTHIYAVVFTKFITVILQTFYILAKILRQFMARGSNTWECNYIIIYRVSYKFSFAPVCHLDKLVEKNEILSSSMSHHFFLISYHEQWDQTCYGTKFDLFLMVGFCFVFICSSDGFMNLLFTNLKSFSPNVLILLIPSQEFCLTIKVSRT